MAERPSRVVAELGRPETPDETAARKAESSRVHRSSQTARNLVAALIVTVAVVAIIAFGVPRGTPPPADPIDVAAIAQRIGDAEGRGVVSPETPAGWLVNRAGIEGDGALRTWTIVYAPADEDERGFLRVAQGFDADEGWPSRVLAGAAAQDTVTFGGITWDRYDTDPSNAGNVSVALATTVGSDIVMIYGMATDEKLDEVATTVASDIVTLREATE